MDVTPAQQILRSPWALLVGILVTTTGVLKTLVDLLGGVNELIEKIQKLRRKHHAVRRKPLENQDEAMPRRSKQRRSKRQTLLIGLLLAAPGIAILAATIAARSAEPLNAQLTREAWEALDRRKLELAISKADECIRKFRRQADALQSSLEKAKGAEPPVGRVSSAEKDAINRNGLLNDVATSFFIKGQALERLHRPEEARQAYLTAKAYTYARCWDPKGWFWSVSEAAEANLESLGR